MCEDRLNLYIIITVAWYFQSVFDTNLKSYEMQQPMNF
jgi:hypothetical protein